MKKGGAAMFLSIIVPVYNAETYICECLNSLIEQDIPKDDYEILCVNDGSTDTSLQILTAYAESYPNITVIDKENGGVTTARNAGLSAAKGDYIWFIDADDFIQENTLLRLRTLAEETGCDRLILGGYQFVDHLKPSERELAEKGQLPVNCPWYDAVVWRCLMRREYLNSHELSFRYPQLTHGEDGLFMYEVTLFDPKDVQIDEVLYFYREHSGSAETDLSPTTQRKKLSCYIQILKILKGHYDSGRKDTVTANKLMSFLHFSLFMIAKLPAAEAKEALDDLKAAGLFPYTRLPECTLERSYMLDRDDLIGKIFDKVYLNLHKKWGYHLIRIIRQMT